LKPRAFPSHAMLEIFEFYWKHRPRDAEQLLIGTYGHQFATEEIFAALGVDSINLVLGGFEAWQTKGIDYMTPTTCVYARQMVGFFEEFTGIMETPQVEGRPKISALVHTNFCSGDFHSAEIVNKYFGLDMYPFPVPYKVTAGAFRLLVQGIRTLIGYLEKLAGVEFDPERLQAVIEQSKEMRSLYEAYSRLPLRGSQKLHDFYEVLLAPWKQKISILNSFIEEHGSEAPDISGDGLNIVLTGSPVLIGDKFAGMLDELDLPARFYDFHFADQRGMKKIPETSDDLPLLKQEVDFNDPVQVLAAYYLEVLAPERMVAGKVDHLDRRIQQVLDYSNFLPESEKIDGVIAHVLKFCDVYGTDRAQFKVRLQDGYNVPVLDIERDYSTAASGQISTRIDAFKEMLVTEKKNADKFE